MSWVVDQRKKLSDDIKAYLASGKQIQQIPKGYSKGTQRVLKVQRTTTA